MKKHIIVLALLLGCSWGSLAQSTGTPANELNSAPPAISPAASQATPTEPSTSPVELPKRKISYGLSAGTQFSRLYGTTTFLEPSVMFPVTKRFSGFASLSFMNTFGTNPAFIGTEAPGNNYTPYNNQRYILHAGGNYLVNDRLNLTGSVWRDLSKSPMPASLNVFSPGGTSGLYMRANYKLTEYLSVSGGFRYSNGNGYNNMWYNPAAPFGF